MWTEVRKSGTQIVTAPVGASLSHLESACRVRWTCYDWTWQPHAQFTKKDSTSSAHRHNEDPTRKLRALMHSRSRRMARGLQFSCRSTNCRLKCNTPGINRIRSACTIT